MIFCDYHFIINTIYIHEAYISYFWNYQNTQSFSKKELGFILACLETSRFLFFAGKKVQCLILSISYLRVQSQTKHNNSVFKIDFSVYVSRFKYSHIPSLRVIEGCKQHWKATHFWLFYQSEVVIFVNQKFRII